MEGAVFLVNISMCEYFEHILLIFTTFNYIHFYNHPSGSMMVRSVSSQLIANRHLTSAVQCGRSLLQADKLCQVILTRALKCTVTLILFTFIYTSHNQLMEVRSKLGSKPSTVKVLKTCWNFRKLDLSPARQSFTHQCR